MIYYAREWDPLRVGILPTCLRCFFFISGKSIWLQGVWRWTRRESNRGIRGLVQVMGSERRKVELSRRGQSSNSFPRTRNYGVLEVQGGSEHRHQCSSCSSPPRCWNKSCLRQQRYVTFPCFNSAAAMQPGGIVMLKVRLWLATCESQGMDEYTFLALDCLCAMLQ